MTTLTDQRHDREAAIIYGSETGNAVDYAEEAGRLLQRLHFQTTVTSIDACEPVRIILCRSAATLAVQLTGE